MKKMNQHLTTIDNEYCNRSYLQIFIRSAKQLNFGWEIISLEIKGVEH